MVGGNDFIEGKVKKLCDSFEAALSKNLLKSKKQLSNGEDVDCSSSSSSFKRALLSSKKFGLSRFNSINLPGTEDRIVVYFTSLRGIRRTYEDCYTVRMILRGFRVPVDERDISMDSAYRKELLSVLGEKTVSLPRVFIRGKYVGGAEEIKQLHEGGELVKLLKGFPLRDPRLVCESCGDARFVPCLNCSGSRKIFCEEEDVMRRCLDCNENGLMRCPNCCH
ncbi:Glutaredoxin domain-containing cysteine-rich protein [Thalictrum thalictroides]|uniref:Glutaredoxin domain-containing cysteine-rich protein n=1 Tax=Thalictrum thalictroides TaxID=46969 RepID=A0A7J6V6S6_THATH|nr:Glutaredoxin domain-containing cysteine-rich protein [Thalictrum thalictroides]